MNTGAISFGTRRGAGSDNVSLLTGAASFSDDLKVAGQVHAVFVRSAMGHANIRAIDIASAKKMPGVLAIFTGTDLARDGIGDIPPVISAMGRDGKPMAAVPIPVLAATRVKYAGEALAIVVAESESQAMDAADAVTVDYEPLRAVSDIEMAMAPDAPSLADNAPGNIVLDWIDGKSSEVDAAFARAHHVERIRLIDNRVAAVALEPRAGVGNWDAASGRYTLVTGTQGVSLVRRLLAQQVLKIPPSSLRVITNDVGGGFGMKAQAYPEYAAILYASRQIGRTVKWRNTRLESFLSDTQGRGSLLEGELALDRSGRFLALRARNLVGIGAYTSSFASVFSTVNTKNCLSSVYRIPAIELGVKVVLTNAVPLGPYRGAGRPEALYVIERLIDAAARSMGIDRVELRRRNLIPPDAMPYQAATGPIYDSGEFEALLDKALALSDWHGFAKRRAISKKAGKLRGIGVCCFLEVAGGALNEKADLRFEEDGTAAIRLGTQAMGQGHASTLPVVVASQLGIPVERVKLIQGDSDEVPDGMASVASRSLMMAGSAAAVACKMAIGKGYRVAAQYFEASEADIQFSEGYFQVAGTDIKVSILDLARRAKGLSGLPDDTGLNTVAEFVSPQLTFPNGCHVCEVEIDPDTGVIAVTNYTAIDDVGNMVNEAVVIGQIHGGVAQGLGQVLGENVVYGDDGQLLTASFMDYFVPRADDVPFIQTAFHVVPCTTNPLGVKGAGESGVAGALPSAMSAILDALSMRGITHIDLPATPDRVWEVLQAAPLPARRSPSPSGRQQAHATANALPSTARSAVS